MGFHSQDNRKYVTFGLIAILAVGIGLTLPTSLGQIAYASTTVPSTGSFVATLAPYEVIQKQDGTQIVFFTFTEGLTGTYSGTEEGAGTFVFNPDGTFKAPHTGTFTGTIAGREGTATLNTKCSGTLASFTCTCITFDGKGGLVGVHAKGTVEGHATGPTTLEGTYSGEVHFGQ